MIHCRRSYLHVTPCGGNRATEAHHSVPQGENSCIIGLTETEVSWIAQAPEVEPMATYRALWPQVQGANSFVHPPSLNLRGKGQEGSTCTTKSQK